MSNIPANELSLRDRRTLVQVACVAAWSDADLAEEERTFVLKLAKSVQLPDEDIERVAGWLKYGPPDLDPNAIPREHKETYLKVVRAVIAADGFIDPEESEVMSLLEELLA